MLGLLSWESSVNKANRGYPQEIKPTTAKETVWISQMDHQLAISKHSLAIRGISRLCERHFMNGIFKRISLSTSFVCWFCEVLSQQSNRQQFVIVSGNDLYMNGQTTFVNGHTSRLCDAFIRHKTMTSLVQIMACRLSGAKPFSEPLLVYCQLVPWEHISVKFGSKHNNIH